MLIAPFSVSLAERSPARSRMTVRPVRSKPPIAGLLVWIAAGIGVLLLVPFARGDRFFGATLPFWLVVAPLVDLAWIQRRKVARIASTVVQRTRSPRRLRGARRLAGGRAVL